MGFRQGRLPVTWVGEVQRGQAKVLLIPIEEGPYLGQGYPEVE